MTTEKSYSYRDAGVNIDAGDALVDKIKPLAKSTRRAGADAALGGFGGLFDLKAAGFTDPVLIAATDGVGTKLRVAIDAAKHDGVGVDLVAMCVNDLVVQGAEPLFFLDYMATGELDVDEMTAVVAGIAEGCRQAGCALIGGETAEMPGMYHSGDYDLAGFSVGAAERGTLIDGSTIKDGDVVIGLTSSGIHSNGYSLVRRIIADHDFEYDDPAPFDSSRSLADALLEPTKIYVDACLKLVKASCVKGFSHITGGGFLENIPRVLPTDTSADIDADAWTLPPIFKWLQQVGNIETREMARTFNCGIGMVAIVGAEDEATAHRLLEEAGETSVTIGKIKKSTGKANCTISGSGGTWGSEEAWTAET